VDLGADPLLGTLQHLRLAAVLVLGADVATNSLGGAGA
jgi:hypothetical protein